MLNGKVSKIQDQGFNLVFSHDYFYFILFSFGFLSSNFYFSDNAACNVQEKALRMEAFPVGIVISR